MAEPYQLALDLLGFETLQDVVDLWSKSGLKPRWMSYLSDGSGCLLGALSLDGAATGTPEQVTARTSRGFETVIDSVLHNFPQLTLIDTQCLDHAFCCVGVPCDDACYYVDEPEMRDSPRIQALHALGFAVSCEFFGSSAIKENV